MTVFHFPFPPLPIPAFASGLAVCLFICLALVLTQSWHGHLTLDASSGVQKFHTDPTPRVGGLGIMGGLLAAWWAAPADAGAVLRVMVLAGLPAFAFGIAEDVTKKVSVRTRLLATMFSGVVAWWLTGVYVSHTDVWGLDWVLAWLPAGVLFTAFAVGGIANAFNIIDGFNGLASGIAMIAFAAFAAIAHQVGDAALAKSCLLLIGVVLGFWLCNFPFGKIFLGDGGAYLVGFLLAWVAVLLPMRNPSVTPWASALVLGYPVLEVFFSIARRMHRQLHPGHPDRLHLHSLVKCRVARKRLAHRLPPVLVNSSVSPLMWAAGALPAMLGVAFHGQPIRLIASFAVCAVAYALVYRRLVRFRWF